MALKINYFDRQNAISKNIAVFVSKETRTSDLKGFFSEKINQKISYF